MYRGGEIFTLDLASRTGVAAGPPGKPDSYSIDLKTTSDDQAVAFGNLIAFLQRVWTIKKPELVVIEKPFSLQAFLHQANGEATVKMAYGLYAIVLGMARRFGIKVVVIAVDTVRKHFIGVAKVGTREETKRAVVARCHLLKLMPANAFDDNRADALALHDWASNTIARVLPAEIFLHEPLPERRKKRKAA